MTPITVYSQPSCQQCTATIRRLTNAGAAFEVEEITDDVRAAAKSMGVTSAPIVQFGDLTIGGYNPIAIDDMVNAQKEMAA